MSERVIVDRTIRRIPGSIWWRLHISLSASRGDFEDGSGPMYRGLVYRWAKRVGPVNVAVLRLR